MQIGVSSSTNDEPCVIVPLVVIMPYLYHHHCCQRCLSVAVSILPPPRDVFVDSVEDTAFLLRWKPPHTPKQANVKLMGYMLSWSPVSARHRVRKYFRRQNKLIPPIIHSLRFHSSSLLFLLRAPQVTPSISVLSVIRAVKTNGVRGYRAQSSRNASSNQTSSIMRETHMQWLDVARPFRSERMHSKKSSMLPIFPVDRARAHINHSGRSKTRLYAHSPH